MVLEYDKRYFNDLYREAFIRKNWKVLQSPMVYEYSRLEHICKHLDFVNGFLSTYASLCLKHCLPRMKEVCHCKFLPNPSIKRNKEGILIPVDVGLLLTRYELHLTTISNLKPLQNANIKEVRKKLSHNLRNIYRILDHFRNCHADTYTVIERDRGFYSIFEIFIATNMIRPRMKKHSPITFHGLVIHQTNLS